MRGVLENIVKLLRAFILRPFFKSCHVSVRLECLGYLVGARYISIGKHSDIQRGTYLTAWDNYGYTPSILIGEDCHIGAYNHITAIRKITIGDGFVSGKWVTITDNAHGEADRANMEIAVSERKVVSKGEVIIGRNVWIGDKATILPGVTIGDGAIVAANAVVTSDVPAFSVVAGIPAKVVRQN